MECGCKLCIRSKQQECSTQYEANGAFELTDYLIKNGKKRIAVIGGKKDNLHTVHRLVGYKKALEKNKLSYDESLITFSNWERNGGFDSTNHFINKKCDFDAIFCFNDLMAAGCFDALLEKNIIPGKDVSVVGFDNREVSEYLKPSLTTMEIPLEEIGVESAKMLLEKDFQNKLIPCKMILRDSV